MIGADGPDELDIPCAANRRDLRAKRFGDLHGERSHTAGPPLIRTFCPG